MQRWRLYVILAIVALFAIPTAVLAALPYWTPDAKECARFQPSPANINKGTASYTDLYTNGTQSAQVFTPQTSYSIAAIKLNVFSDTSTNAADHSGATEQMSIHVAPLGANGFPQKSSDVTYVTEDWTYSIMASVPTPLAAPDGAISSSTSVNGWAAFECGTPLSKTSLQTFPNANYQSGQLFSFATPVPVVALTPYAMIVAGKPALSGSPPQVGLTWHGNNDSYDRGTSFTCPRVGGFACWQIATVTPSQIWTQRAGDYGFAIYSYPSEYGTPTPVPTIVDPTKGDFEMTVDGALSTFNAATQWGYVMALIVVTLLMCAALSRNREVPAALYGFAYAVLALIWVVFLLDAYVAMIVLITIPFAIAGGAVAGRRANA